MAVLSKEKEIMDMEKVTAVALVGDKELVAEKIGKVLKEDFNYYVESFPFSATVSAEEKKMSYGKDDTSDCYVENGLVLPDGVEEISFTIPVDRDVYLKGNKADVTLTPGAGIPGFYYVTVEGTYEDGTSADMEHIAFLDGKKIAKSAKLPFEEVERGSVDKKGDFVVASSKVRPEAVREVEKVEEVKEKEPVVEEVKKEPRKSVMQRHIDAGFPDKINDMGTGLNRVYMRTFAGEFNKLRYAELFPKDPNLVSPILSDSRLNLSDVSLIEIKAVPKGKRCDISFNYLPGDLAFKVANFDSQHSAYGPSLAKDLEPGHPRAGTLYYMDVTGMNEEELKKLEKAITKSAKEANTAKKEFSDVIDIVLKEASNFGAKSPVLALGKAFDEVVKEREADEKNLAEKLEEELKERNSAIRKRIKELQKAGERIPREERVVIHVRAELMTPPDKEKDENFYKIPCKLQNREYEIRVPASSRELGQDGRSLMWVKKLSTGNYEIHVSRKLANPFMLCWNGGEIKSFNVDALNAFVDEKNSQLRNAEYERNYGMSYDAYRRAENDERRQKDYAISVKESRQGSRYDNDDFRGKRSGGRSSLRPRFNRGNGRGNSGYDDGM